MTEEVDIAQPADASVLDQLPMRDESGEIRHQFVEEITRAIHEENTSLLRAVVAELHEADLGDLIAALEPDDRVKLVELTGADFDFSALNEVDDSVREEILEELEPETVAEGVRELESDDAVELLETLDEEDQEEVLEKLPAKERDTLERSLLYPENSAGRRMQTEFITVPPDWNVGQAIDYMRDKPNLPDRFYEIYAVDKAQHWHGAVALDALLRSRRLVPLADLIDEDRRRVSVLDDQEEVARLFGKYNLVAAPVVDTENRLVGVITIDDVVDVIEEEADEDLRALGGVTSDEELSDSVWTIARGRFNWLLVNLATAFLASSVLGLFEGQLENGGVGRAGADRCQPGRQCRDPDHDGRGARSGHPRTRLQQRVSGGGPRGPCRSRQRPCLCRHHRHRRGGLVQDPRSWPRYRARDHLQSGCRRAWRHSDSDGAGAGAGRSGGGVGHLRHNGH